MTQTKLIMFVVVIAAIMLIVYVSQPNTDQDNTLQNDQVPTIKSSSVTESFDSSKKGINYFGGHHCPHSRENSSMYNLINDRLRSKYPDVEINIYWASEHGDLFNKYNIEYVPTLLNNSGENVVAGLPEGVDRDNKSDDELEEMVLENISNQL